MKQLYPSAFNNFLLAYPRASSVHGVYTLWLRKQRKIKIYTKAYRNLNESNVHFKALKGIYRCIKETLVPNYKRLNKLLRYKWNISNLRCNDLVCRRSKRLKKKGN